MLAPLVLTVLASHCVTCVSITTATLSPTCRGDLYAQLMVDLNLERSTWELIRALYSDRVDADNMLGGSDSDEDGSMITDLMVSHLAYEASSVCGLICTVFCQVCFLAL